MQSSRRGCKLTTLLLHQLWGICKKSALIIYRIPPCITYEKHPGKPSHLSGGKIRGQTLEVKWRLILHYILKFSNTRVLIDHGVPRKTCTALIRLASEPFPLSRKRRYINKSKGWTTYQPWMQQKPSIFSFQLSPKPIECLLSWLWL